MRKCEKDGKISYQSDECSSPVIPAVTKPTESALSDSFIFKDGDSTADKVENIYVEEEIHNNLQQE